MTNSNVAPSVRSYFVDEAGDGVLFDASGREILGTPGCSRFFILGVLDARDPAGLENDLADLRKSLLADPYLASVPSMQRGARKTALAFHAHDDTPEVRQAVFKLLLAQDVRFLAVVRDKRQVLDYVRRQNAMNAGYRYSPNELYEYLVRRLFRNLLHKEDVYYITFARRGAKDRTKSLRGALEAARERFAARFGISNSAQVHVSAQTPITCPALQAADYFLWALQRFYERGEDRYLTFLWPRFRLVNDLDDTRRHSYGEYYTKERPLDRAALQGRPGI
jgi:hypothetical protein